MQISWTKVKDALLNLTTSNKLTEAEATAIQSAIESDAALGATAETATPVVQAAVVVPAVASTEVPNPAVPTAQVVTQPTTPAPVASAVPVASESDELKALRAENARLKAQITPALAAAVPSEDLTQTGQSTTAEDVPNAYLADLKRIKEKYNRFGLTDNIKLGDSQK